MIFCIGSYEDGVWDKIPKFLDEYQKKQTLDYLKAFKTHWKVWGTPA